MRKEVLFAIVAGVSIGLIIAFGTWRATQLFKKTNNSIVDVKKSIPNQNNISLSISNLNPFDIVTEKPFKLSGITKPNSWVVVSTTEEDYFEKSKEDGSFEIEVELPSGLSEIKINSLKIPVVFSTEFAKYLDTSETSETQEETKTDSTEEKPVEEAIDAIREKIKEEISEKSLKKIAYVGTITDIASGNIQIKSVQGDIKQISVSDETSYVNTLKKNVEIKSTDLAIGDYIVAMGFLNGNKVLDTKRILVSEAITTNKYESVIGKVSQISKTKITIERENGEMFEAAMPKKWVGPNISEIEVGQFIIVVGNQEDETYTLRTIFTPVE